MPIVACPGCSARLNAPENAAGKRVKCPTPGCGTLVPVPALIAAEVEEADEDRPRGKRRRDEDDDRDDNRPRRKNKRKAGGLSPAAVAGIVIGGLVLVAAAGYGVYALVSKKDDSSGGGGGGGGSGGGAKIPTGWVEHRSDGDKFRAYFPKAPISSQMPSPNKKLLPARSITRYTSGSPGDDQYVILFVAQLPPTAAQADQDAYAEDFARAWRTGAGVREGTAAWGGKPAREFVVPKPATKTRPESGTVVRQVTVGNTLYGAVVANARAVPSPEFVNGFFDNFEFLD